MLDLNVEEEGAEVEAAEEAVAVQEEVHILVEVGQGPEAHGLEVHPHPQVVEVGSVVPVVPNPKKVKVKKPFQH